MLGFLSEMGVLFVDGDVGVVFAWNTWFVRRPRVLSGLCLNRDLVIQICNALFACYSSTHNCTPCDKTFTPPGAQWFLEDIYTRR